MPSPYLCERYHPTRGCVSPNFRPETTFSKVAGRVRTADLQTRRLPLNPLLHGGLTTKRGFSLMSNDEKKKNQPIFQILHIKSAWFLQELAMALVTTIGMRFLQVWDTTMPD